MIKIQLVAQVTPEYPAGRAGELLWSKGQPWPIAQEDDEKIVMIEAFGDELAEISPRFSGGRTLKDEAGKGKETCRTWFLDEARYVSKQMRVFYP